MGVIETIKRQEREEGIKTGIEKGKIEGKIEGKIQGKIEMLKELGYSIVDVCKKLSLTEDQVKKYYTGA